ncbi:alkaline phosphatase [Staphylococcus massiliensis]|uniref:Alkaline phosphatase n=1 Tax=Staphylococcus massiliensis S46 TaxID=1229783 RepID=K9AR40_9STAP|nr:alkaline phosphatase [Staphylococcus massiliensis]EKU48496.1 alkaline phosphatase [Staphylococcus massiliensis S46]MCG3400381.1 alkaline phosphatase [Staphylococcus massiliensis]MCG3401772.1 alkaline phosphatase [Staphylococcus massiliensis]MCG3412644.1 alkaline phosphatase [Staphylococcus massiliensis]POA01505.1 alkaline phosphatase [Staphylococcus massiliensis CCUG 55927]
MKMFNKLAATTLASTLIATSLGVTNVTLASGAGEAPEGTQLNQGQQGDMAMYGNTENPKNIIFLVGDGMGPAFNTAYRHFKDNPDTEEVEKTAFDDYFVGDQSTSPKDPEDDVTDSAAGATAFSTGHKTYNGAISVNEKQERLKSVLEQAKENGKSTGLVSTAEITDATPAAYAAHVKERGMKDEIAQQFFNDKINGQHKVDVLLGGGSKYFGEENGNLKEKFAQDGYEVVENREDLLNSKDDQLLGLFSEGNMPLQIDAPEDDPRLVEMQSIALDRLQKNDKGFFLMVEGASIDKSAHPNDITGVMSEMEGFEKAFENATNYAKQNPDTLVVATADHSTGGLSMAKGKEYRWDPEYIRQMKHSGSYMTDQIIEGKDVEEVIQNGYGFDLDKEQMKAIKKEAKALSKLDEEKDGDKYGEQKQKLQDAIQKPINDKSNTGWTTYGHTGVDVNTYGFGPGIDSFRGHIDNTDSAKNIFDFYKNEVQ